MTLVQGNRILSLVLAASYALVTTSHKPEFNPQTLIVDFLVH